MRRASRHLLALVCIGAVLVVSTATAFAQSDEPKTCNDLTIVLDDADALDEFSERGCKVLGGDLIIRGNELDVEDLSALDGLQRIVGDLRIQGVHSLQSLEGLEALEKVMGDVRIVGNDGLATLEGLGLTRTEGSVVLAYLPALEGLEGLSSFRYAGGDFRLVGLPRVESLAGLGHLVNVGRVVHVAYLARLTTLEGADDMATAEGLVIEGNTRLEAFDGFANLSKIESEGLTIRDNPQLSTLEVPPELDVLGGDIVIEHNGDLDGCEVAEGLSKLGREFWDGNVTIEGTSEDCR